MMCEMIKRNDLLAIAGNGYQNLLLSARSTDDRDHSSPFIRRTLPLIHKPEGAIFL